MNAKNSTKAATKPRAIELLLSPVNNTQLANLCGPLDENLRQIETALDVSIARRGERFTLRGEREQTARASEALQIFYAQAKESLSVDEIQLGLIELINKPARKDAPVGGNAPLLISIPHLGSQLPEAQRARMTEATPLDWSADQIGMAEILLSRRRLTGVEAGGLRQLPPAVVSSLGLLSPVCAYVLGWVLLNQAMGWRAMLGFVLVLASIYGVQRALARS